MRNRIWILAVAATIASIVAGCAPSESDARTACWQHVRESAGVSQGEIDWTNTATAKQGKGWLVKGTITSNAGPKFDYYCQLNKDLNISDSLVSPQ